MAMYYKIINTGSPGINRKKVASLVTAWLLSCLIPLAGQNLHLFPGVSVPVGQDTADYQVASEDNIPTPFPPAGERSSTGFRTVEKEHARFLVIQEFLAGIYSPYHEYVTFFMVFALKWPAYQVIPVLILTTGKRLIFRGKAGMPQNTRLNLAEN